MIINPKTDYPKRLSPCSVEDCPNYIHQGWYQVHGITLLGVKAMRVVLFLCKKHEKEYGNL